MKRPSAKRQQERNWIEDSAADAAGGVNDDDVLSLVFGQLAPKAQVDNSTPCSMIMMTTMVVAVVVVVVEKMMMKMVHSPSHEEPKSSTTVAKLFRLFHRARSYQERAESSPDRRHELQVAGQSNGRRNAPSCKPHERPTSTGSQRVFPCTFFCHQSTQITIWMSGQTLHVTFQPSLKRQFSQSTYCQVTCDV